MVSGKTGSLHEKTQAGSLPESPTEVGATWVKGLSGKDQTGTLTGERVEELYDQGVRENFNKTSEAQARRQICVKLVILKLKISVQ